MASHVGVVLGVPTIGVPKTPYHPSIQAPGPARGDYYVLTRSGGRRGLHQTEGESQTRLRLAGHLVDLPSAIALALIWSTGRRRVPEPLSAAHTLSLECGTKAG